MVVSHSANVAAAGCGPLVGLKGLRVARPMFPLLPEKEHVPYPEADAIVSCLVGTGGKLQRCTSTLRDPRGTVLANYVTKWRIRSGRAAACKVTGRVFKIRFRLRNDEHAAGARLPNDYLLH